MGRIYYAYGSSTQSTAGDILAITAPSTGMVCLHEVSVANSSTETDDSTEIRISRFATAGSGGTNLSGGTPAQVGHATGGATVRVFDTTDASSTETILWREGISILAGWHKVWTPETRIWVPPSGNLVVKFVGDITSCTMTVSAIFEEFD